MKTLNLIPAMLTTLTLLTPAMHGQNDSDVPKQVIEARCQYTADAACTSNPSTQPSAEASVTVAQVPRRGPRPPMRPGRYPRAYPSYRPPPMWAGDGHRAAIGALIGLGIGATVGAAAPSDSHPGTRLLGGLIFGGLGAAMGAAVANPIFTLHARSRHPFLPSRHPEDQDELARRYQKSPESESSDHASSPETLPVAAAQAQPTEVAGP